MNSLLRVEGIITSKGKKYIEVKSTIWHVRLLAIYQDFHKKDEAKGKKLSLMTRLVYVI